jgi:hypothetical protein
VISQSPDSLIDPFFLGSPDENDVMGYTGTPVNVNGYLSTYRVDVQAAGVQYPVQGRYYVAVDSGVDDFTGKSLAGSYLLHFWRDDVTPPTARIVTTTVSAGRPTIVARALDRQAGVDPLSLTFAYGRVQVGATAYDPISGLAVIPLPTSVPELGAGTPQTTLVAWDFQENKNVDQAGTITSILPNTTFVTRKLRVVNRPTVTWLLPSPGDCAAAKTELLVVAGATRKIANVRFSVDGRTIGTVETGAAGLYAKTWSSKGLAPGKHTLLAVVTDASGATASATHAVRACTKKK